MAENFYMINFIVIIAVIYGGKMRDEFESKRDLDALIKDLGSKDKEKRWRASEDLAGLGKKAVDSLVKALKKEKDDIKVGAAITLGKIEGIDPNPLIEALNDKNWEVRWAAATSLGNLGAREAVDALINLLRDDSWDVRRVAAISLGKIKDPKAVKPLVEALKSDRLIRFEAARALIQIGEDAVPELIPLLQIDDIDVRMKAAEIFGLIGDEGAVEPLIQLLNDHDQGIRDATSKALAKIGGRAIEGLISFLRSGDYKLEALKALVEVDATDTHFDEILEVLAEMLKEEDEDVRYEAVVNLGKMGEKGIKYLLEALEDESELVRRGAAMALVLNGEVSLTYLERELKGLSSEKEEKAKLLREIIGRIKR